MPVAINGIDQSTPSVEDYGAAVQDITALKLVGPSERFDQQQVYVEDETRPYWFDLDSAAAESLPDIVQPGDVPAVGRWIRLPPAGGVPSAHGSTHTSIGTDAIPAAVAAGASGLMTGADKTILDGVAASTDVVLRDGTQGLTGPWDTGAQGILTDFIKARFEQDLVFKEDDDTVIIRIIQGGSVIISQDLDPVQDDSRSIGDGSKRWRRIFGINYPSVDEKNKIVIGDTGVTLLSKDSAAGASVTIAQTDGAAPVSSATALDSRKLGFQAELWDVTPLIRTGSVRFEGDGATDDQGRFTLSSDDQGGAENDFLHVFRTTFGDVAFQPTGNIFLLDSTGASRASITTAGVAFLTDQTGAALIIQDLAGSTRLQIFEQDTDSVSLKIGQAAGSIIVRDSSNVIMLRINGSANKIVHHVKLEPDGIDTITIGTSGLPYKQVVSNIFQPGTGKSLLLKDAGGTDKIRILSGGTIELASTVLPFTSGLTNLGNTTKQFGKFFFAEWRAPDDTVKIKVDNNGIGLLGATPSGSNVVVAGDLVPDDDTRTFGSDGATWSTAFIRNLRADTGSALKIRDGSGFEAINVLSASVVINETGLDRDTRIEGDTDPNLGFFDAGNDRFGVGTDTPGTKLDVNGVLTVRGDILPDGDTRTFGSDIATWALAIVRIVRSDPGQALSIQDATGDSAIDILGSSTVINIAGTDRDLVVEGSGDANLGFFDAGTDRFGVGIGVPLAKLHVDQFASGGAVPVLLLDQADVSEEFIQFSSAVGVGEPLEAEGGKTFTVTHFARVSENGTFKYIQLGTIA